MDVLKKIRKAGKMNGFAIDLAEAQAKDFVTLKNRVETIENDVTSIKQTLVEHGTKLDLIIQRLNSPVEEERKDGIFWSQLKAMGKTTTGKIIILLIIGCIALAGQRILELIGLIQ
jgi:trans-2-enoyl-CoA reductase